MAEEAAEGSDDDDDDDVDDDGDDEEHTDDQDQEPEGTARTGASQDLSRALVLNSPFSSCVRSHDDGCEP